MSFKQKACAFGLRLIGWTADSGPAPEKKAILLGVPHTSMMDFVVSYLFYNGVGGDAHVIIKSDIFKGPLGWLLRKLGAIPVDRGSGATFLKSIIEEFDRNETFHIAMCPEGTRKATKHWKMGYHAIAKATGAAVYMSYFDWGTKHIGIGKKFELTDDAKADTAAIQDYYSTLGLVGRHKDGYVAK